MVQLGELSAGRNALEGADFAQGNKATLRELNQRQSAPRHPIPSLPDKLTVFNLEEKFFCRNVGSARKRAAKGPSGMSGECLHCRANLLGNRPGCQAPDNFSRKNASHASRVLALIHSAISTRALDTGCECIAHVLQAVWDLDTEASVISLDGITLLTPFHGGRYSAHDGIRIHGSRTHVWNSAGSKQDVCDALQRIGQV